MSVAPAVAAPICAVHRKPMRQGQYRWFCSTFVGIGLPGANAKGYCDQGVKNATPAATPAGATAPNGAAPESGDARIAAAALTFAGNLYAGAGDGMNGGVNEEVAIACAVRAYQALKAAK